MNNYTVTIPLAGHVTVYVQAKDAESAIDIAFEKAGEVSVNHKSMTDNDIDEFNWEYYMKMSEGNVRYYHNDRMEVTNEGPVEEEYEDPEK